MKETPKCRGLFVIGFIVVTVALGGAPVSRTSFAAEDCFAAEDAFGKTNNNGSTNGLPLGSDHFAYVIGYPDGTIKPLGAITREETAVIFYRLMPEERRNTYAGAYPPFTDVGSGRWSNEEIAALYQAGIIQGNPDGSYQPEKPVTRAEFSAIAARFARLEEAEEAKENKFPDIENHWAEKYINLSAEKGWIKGYGDGTFRPDNLIIRCEAMMLINEVLDRRVNTAGLLEDAKQWPDNAEEKWYYEIVMEATNTHDYDRADRPKSTEKWTKIEENPVW